MKCIYNSRASTSPLQTNVQFIWFRDCLRLCTDSYVDFVVRNRICWFLLKYSMQRHSLGEFISILVLIMTEVAIKFDIQKEKCGLKMATVLYSYNLTSSFWVYSNRMKSHRHIQSHCIHTFNNNNLFYWHFPPLSAWAFSDGDSFSSVST